MMYKYENNGIIMKKTKVLSIILASIVLVLIFASLVACDKKQDGTPAEPYVEIIDDDDALVFKPMNSDVKYGLLFYVGTSISPQKYSYLGNALANEGYLVYIPKTRSDMPYQYFEEKELAFEKYPEVQFFIGGHSNQGADAALRRISETERKELGAIFFSPITVGHYQVFDKDGQPVKDEKGFEVYEDYTLADATDLPTLYISGNEDAVCTQAQTDEAKSRMPQNCVYKTIEHGNHTAFAEINENSDLPIALQFFPNFKTDVSNTTIAQKGDQRTLTVYYVLQFIKDNAK